MSQEIIGWCPDCNGPVSHREIKTMEGIFMRPVCALCGPIEDQET